MDHGEPAMTSELPTGAIVVTPARHTILDDAFGILTGCVVASIGISLLHAGGVVTGGTVGLGLLIAYGTGWGFPLVYVLINIPFLLLAWWKRGARFTLTTVATVLVLAGMTSIGSSAFAGLQLEPWYSVIAGNVLCGAGMLMLFRHNSSLGGLNTLAMLAQEYWGVRAGWVQMVLDGTVVLLAFTVANPL
ncbi:MAG: YitT family protein, partial [Agromyces sp.]